jgi:hypothetical protein
MIAATCVVLTKVENTPDYKTIMQTLTTLQDDLQTTMNVMKTTAETAQTTAPIAQQAMLISQDTNAGTKDTNSITKEVSQAGKAAELILQETNNIAKTIQSPPSRRSSYASVLSSNPSPLSKPITLSTQTPSLIQAQREIIVKITNPNTIESLRAKNTRALQGHVARAIEQSKNKHIENIRVVSANQLKSRDLSIKTTKYEDAEALKEFANDWTGRIGNGASIRVPTYGIIAHGIRTKSIGMARFEEVKPELLQGNKPFIPVADIKYIGWLSKSAPTKSASSIIVEFTRPEDANKIIDGPIQVFDQFYLWKYFAQVYLCAVRRGVLEPPVAHRLLHTTN